MVAQRNAEQTREKILLATFEIIYRHGFQGMRVEQVLKATNLAKGALYHHFKGKQALGYAVVEEVLMTDVNNRWIEPLSHCDDPLIGIKQILDNECAAVPDEMLSLGCPLNNISQEMAGIDDGFKERLMTIYTAWNDGIETALADGITKGYVRADVKPQITAAFIISAMQGIIGTVKCVQDKPMMIALKDELVSYIMNLRAIN